MSVPVMSLLPQFAPAPVQADPSSAPAATSGSAPAHDSGFDGLLASLATPQSTTKADQTSQDAAPPATGADAKDQLQQALSALAGAPVDLNAPGLGLTKGQQQELLAKLEKLTQTSSEDGAQLLAGLLAGSQLAVTLQPADIAALTTLLGTSAQGTVSVDALSSNLHLLTQAVQLMASSDGQMTLLQAVQELTPPGDVFTQQLAAALATDQPAEIEPPAAVDTGPPKTSSSGGEPREEAESAVSATAGSNGHESTVAPTGETSPADGAAKEAITGPAMQTPDVEALAKAIEDLLVSQPKAPGGQSASPAQQSGNQPAVPAQAQTGQPVPAVAPAAQLAQMAPVTTPPAQPQAPATEVVAAQAKPTTVAALSGSQPQATLPKVEVQPSTALGSAPVPAGEAAAQATVAVQTDSQSQQQGQGSTGQHAGSTSAGAQAPVTAASGPAIPVQGTFASALEASSSGAGASARPAIDQAVLDQVVQNATLALSNGQQEFRVQLKPEFLGAMEVRVSMDNGVVAVRMSVESTATRQLIDNNIGQLRQAFGTDQVRVEHVPNFESSDAPSSSWQGGQQAPWQGQNPYNGSAPLPEAIPYTGEFQLPGMTAEPEAVPVAAQTSTPMAPGAIDIQV